MLDRMEIYKLDAALLTASRFALTATVQRDPEERAASVQHAIDFLRQAAEAAGYRLVSIADMPDPAAALVETLTENVR